MNKIHISTDRVSQNNKTTKQQHKMATKDILATVEVGLYVYKAQKVTNDTVDLIVEDMDGNEYRPSSVSGPLFSGPLFVAINSGNNVKSRIESACSYANCGSHKKPLKLLAKNTPWPFKVYGTDDL